MGASYELNRFAASSSLRYVASLESHTLVRLENCIIAEALQIAKNILLLSLSDVASALVMVTVCPTNIDLAKGSAGVVMWSARRWQEAPQRCLLF